MARSLVKKVTEDLYLLRMDDDETRYFESIWEIPEGVTYNAYILVTERGAALFDAWKRRYADEMLEAIRSVVDVVECRGAVDKSLLERSEAKVA